MKKILFLFLLCCPLMCAAQSEWELPTAQQDNKNATNDNKKQTEAGKTDASKTAEIKDWQYIKEGAVPEVDGKVVFEHDIEFKGKTAQQIYDLAYTALDSLAHSDNQINSNIALINRKEHSIVARYQEWLEFSKSFISLDRSKFNYVIIAKCDNEKLHISMERMSFSYEEGRSTGFHETAEKWIADKYAVNKKRTKLIPGTAKFRKGTIDRKDEIFRYIEKKMK